MKYTLFIFILLGLASDSFAARSVKHFEDDEESKSQFEQALEGDRKMNRSSENNRGSPVFEYSDGPKRNNALHGRDTGPYMSDQAISGPFNY